LKEINQVDEEEFALNFIKEIYEKIVPRLAFSKKEKEGAKYSEKE